MLQKYKNNWETCLLFSPKNILPATFDAFIGFFRLIIRQSGPTFYNILYLCKRKSLEKVAEQNKKSLEKRAWF